MQTTWPALASPMTLSNISSTKVSHSRHSRGRPWAGPCPRSKWQPSARCLRWRGGNAAKRRLQPVAWPETLRAYQTTHQPNRTLPNRKINNYYTIHDIIKPTTSTSTTSTTRLIKALANVAMHIFTTRSTACNHGHGLCVYVCGHVLLHMHLPCVGVCLPQ